MTDVLFLAMLVVFFSVAVAFVYACERIVGPDLDAEAPVDAAEQKQAAA